MRSAPRFVRPLSLMFAGVVACGTLMTAPWATPAPAHARAALLAAADDQAPDALTILRRSDEALRALKTIRYSATREGFGAATTAAVVTGTVQIERPTPGEPATWRFGIDANVTAGAVTQPRRFATFSDGATVSRVQYADAQIFTAPASDAEALLDGAGGFLTSWLLRWPDLINDTALGGNAPVRLAGERVVDGQLCDIVYLDLSQTDHRESAVWFFIARSDNLLRRLEVAAVTEEGELLMIALVLAGVQSNAPLDADLGRALPDFPRKPFPAQANAEAPPAPREPASPAVGQPAPAFELTTAEGRKVSLESLKGQVVLIDFWATWCGPCIRAMPTLQKIHDAYSGKGVAVFGINTFEEGDPVKFKKDKGYTYGLLLEGDETAKAYGVEGIPAFFVIGKNGKIAASITGFSRDLEQKLTSAIDAALAAP